MRTTHRTGAYWFVQRLCEFYHRDRPDSDTTYFFLADGRLIRQDDPDLLDWVRALWAEVVLFQRLDAKRQALAKLRKRWDRRSIQEEIFYGAHLRRRALERSIRALKQRLNKPKPRNKLHV